MTDGGSAGQQAGMERMEARFRSPGGPFLCPAGFPVPEGTKEWAVEKGPEGDQGERGPRGLARLSRRSTYALAAIAVTALVVVGCALGLAFSSVRAAHRSEQLAQQALAIVHRHGSLCTAISQLAAEQPPPGSAASNPSRAYLQEQHATFVELHRKFDCN